MSTIEARYIVNKAKKEAKLNKEIKLVYRGVAYLRK
jgi:hypothetical protein|tara:strand:+ start:258 stop:365 length:108 start_codon:yes stop_codon:yes gene_type:complete